MIGLVLMVQGNLNIIKIAPFWMVLKSLSSCFLFFPDTAF